MISKTPLSVFGLDKPRLSLYPNGVKDCETFTHLCAPILTTSSLLFSGSHPELFLDLPSLFILFLSLSLFLVVNPLTVSFSLGVFYDPFLSYVPTVFMHLNSRPKESPSSVITGMGSMTFLVFHR